MIRIYPAESRYSTDRGWLQTNFSFSFAGYYDPENTEFGPLRVFNDDVVAPRRGIGMHPHRDMEIVTVVLEGRLEHADSMGNREIIRAGEIQRMTAGTGIYHSEMNSSEDEPVNLLQIWFEPSSPGLAPSYEQMVFDPDAMRNRLLSVVSGTKRETPTVFIHQDLTMYLTRLDAGSRLEFVQPEGRRIYVFVMEGGIALNGDHRLSRRDAARIAGTPKLRLEAGEDGAYAMLIDLP